MKVIYTYTDEAPALATHSFLPVVEAFAAQGRGRRRDPRHLAGRAHPRAVPGPADRRPAGARLAGRARRAGHHARGQHHQAAQHQRVDPAAQGGHHGAAGRRLRHPGLPGEPADRRGAAATRTAYDAVKGSAVNPVLREGNSDRRAPASVKSFARKHPHSMGAWSADSASHVATMERRRLPALRDVGHARRGRRAAHRARRGADGTVTVLKESVPVLAGRDRRRRGDERAPRWTRSWPSRSPTPRQRGVLFSVHLKATMMKVSDPILFGHAVHRLLRRRVRAVRRRPRLGRRRPERRPRQRPHRAGEAARREARGHREGDHRHLRQRPARWRWSTPTAASPTCTCPAT